MASTSMSIGVAIARKDVLALYPLLLLTLILQVLAILVARLDVWAALNFFLPTMLILANSVVVLV
jgi:hypothetical protein